MKLKMKLKIKLQPQQAENLKKAVVPANATRIRR